MSHTVKMQVNLTNKQAIENACKILGHQYLGDGSHRLFGSTEKGTGFKLKGWNYPCIVKENGEMAFDNYNGSWGNMNDFEAFKEAYSVACVQDVCSQNGWYNELTPQGELVIHHPGGGTITVQKGGTIDAAGFVGVSCAEATSQIESALGKRLEEQVKPEMRMTHNLVKEQGE